MQSDKSKGHSGSEKIKEVNRIEKLNGMHGTYYVELEFQKSGIIYIQAIFAPLNSVLCQMNN